MQKRFVHAELLRRRELWDKLIQSGGPWAVKPEVPRELGILAGYRGIYRNLKHTKLLTPSGPGVTLSILTTGVHCDDILTSTTLTYSYPETQVPGADAGDIEATKMAKHLGIPIFVIVQTQDLRNVMAGTVETWSDTSKNFTIGLSADWPVSLSTATSPASTVAEEDAI